MNKRHPTLALAATAFAAAFLASTALALPAQAQSTAITKQMVAPMNEARTAIQAQDYATAKAKLDVAAGFAKTPQDGFALEQMRFAVAEGSKDASGKVKAIEALIASNLLVPIDLKRYKAGLAQAYQEAGDTAKATQVFRAFVDEFGGTPEQFAGIANDAVKAGDNATGETYARKALDAAKAAGAKPPESHYRILMRALNQSKQMDKYYQVEEQVLADYPKEAYWKELIARAQSEPGFGTTMRLDLFRTLIAAGVTLTPTEKATMGEDAMKRGLPSEAVAILEPAITGELASNAAAKATLDRAKTAAKDDQAGLAKEEKDTLAKGSGADIASLGEVYLSYGDNAKAAELIQKGIAKGVPNAGEADMAKLHLGIAQFRAGQKDAARATWAEIKANNGASVLARNWVLISNKP